MLIKRSSAALLLLLTASTSSLQVLADDFVAQKAPPPKFRMTRLDVSKRAAEFPMKSIIGNRGASFPQLADSVDVGTEPAKLANPETVSPAKSVDSNKPSLKPQPTNEKVEPGKVRWHKAVQTAMDASKRTGKPVLLFQMMGRLDDRFC